MWLVTGATGHIGNVLIRKLLDRGEKVRALILPGESRAPIQGLDVEAVEGDILDLDSVFESLRGVKGIFHLAGVISIMPGSNPFVRKVNVDGTKNILRAAMEKGVRKLVYTSSIHAIRRAEDGVIDETLPYDTDNPYGAYDRSKAEATLEVIHAAHAGLEAVVVCPTGVIGPYDFRGSMMGTVIHDAAAAKPTLYVDGAYDFVDVRDVADGLISAAENGTRGGSYILSGNKITVRYLLETVREATGKNFFQMKIPFDLAKFAAMFTPMYYRLAHATPRFTPYSLEVLHSNSDISHAKATRELSYRPRSIYESIADTVKWFFENKKIIKETQGASMKIVTDCAADMPNEELEELGIVQAPLFIQFPEGEVNSADISADDFYNRLEAMRPAIPTTAQPSGGIFAELYRKLAQKEKDIFSIHISSGLSGTINAARDGGEQVKEEVNVSYWDTLTLSGGERFQVMAAALASKAGWAMHTIQERLAAIREKTEVIYTLDTLEYLARGGRIGRVKALAGALLNLKPVIRVDSDGKYTTVTTGRTLNKSMAAIVEYLREKYGTTPLWVTVLHGRFAEKADILANEIKEKLNITKLEIQRISPVLGVHTGPGIVGVAVVPMELMGDLAK